MTVAREEAVPEAFYEAVGFRAVGDRAVRVDILDRVAIRLIPLARRGPFNLPPDLVSLLGLSTDQTAEVIVALGYRRVDSRLIDPSP